MRALFHRAALEVLALSSLVARKGSGNPPTVMGRFRVRSADNSLSVAGRRDGMDTPLYVLLFGAPHRIRCSALAEPSQCDPQRSELWPGGAKSWWRHCGLCYLKGLVLAGMVAAAFYWGSLPPASGRG